MIFITILVIANMVKPSVQNMRSIMFLYLQSTLTIRQYFSNSFTKRLKLKVPVYFWPDMVLDLIIIFFSYILLQECSLCVRELNKFLYVHH